MLSELKTERLTLRLLSHNDDEFIIELLNSEGWLKFIGQRNVHNIEQARAYTDKVLGTPNFFYWVARLHNSGSPIGIVSFLKRDYLPHFDIGFAMLPGYCRNGYAYEATKEILLMVSGLGYSPVLATTLPHNSASAGLLKKLGFHLHEQVNVNGVLHDVHRFLTSAH